MFTRWGHLKSFQGVRTGVSNRLNSSDESKQPCRTPVDVSKLSETPSQVATRLLKFEYISLINETKFCGIPKWRKMCYRPSLHIQSKACLKSLKRWKILRPCSRYFSITWRTVNIWSMVDLFGQKPAWYSGITVEAIALIRSSITLVSILAIWLVRFISR